MTACIGAAALPAQAEGAAEWSLQGGTMKITDPDGLSVKGTTVGLGGSATLLEAHTDSGIVVDVRGKGVLEAVDLNDTEFSYSFEDNGDDFDVFRGYGIDGRGHAVLELGISYVGFRFTAATGFQGAHVKELWRTDGPGTADDYASAFGSFGAGKMDEFTLGYAAGEFSIGAFYRKGTLELSSSEYNGSSSSYDLTTENVGGFVAYRRRG